MNYTTALRYAKFNQLLTFHLQSVSFPCRKMVFSDDDNAVIQNYVEKGLSAYRICKEHPTKKWYKGSVQRLINQFKENNTMKRRPGSEDQDLQLLQKMKKLLND